MRRTVEVARGGPRPTIRLRRVPPCEPPYDDEREQPFWPIANQMPLNWSPATPTQAGLPPPTTPAHPERPDRVEPRKAPDPNSEARPARRDSEPAQDRELAFDSEAAQVWRPARDAEPIQAREATQAREAAPARAQTRKARESATADERGWAEAGRPRIDIAAADGAAASLGGLGGTLAVAAPVRARTRTVVAGTSADAKAAVHRFVRLCVEVLNGYRPAAHLRKYSLPGEAAGIVAQGLAAAQRVASLRKAAQAPGRRPPRRPSPAAVVRLRLCEPRPGAVEAAVALVTGERTWALALRLELHQDTWSATALRLI